MPINYKVSLLSKVTWWRVAYSPEIGELQSLPVEVNRLSLDNNDRHLFTLSAKSFSSTETGTG